MLGAAAVGARDVVALVLTANTNAKAQADKQVGALEFGGASVRVAANQPNKTN